MSALDCQTFAHSLPGGSLCGGTRWSPAKVQVTGEGWWGLCLTGLGGFLVFWGDGCQRALKCHKARACIQSFGFWGVKQSLWNLVALRSNTGPWALRLGGSSTAGGGWGEYSNPKLRCRRVRPIHYNHLKYTCELCFCLLWGVHSAVGCSRSTQLFG